MIDPWKRPLEILAVIVSILFVVSTPVAFTLYSLERTVFDANLYIQAMDETDLYQQLPALTAQALAQASQRAGNPGILSIFRNLSIEQWHGLLARLLPPVVLRPITVDAVIQIIAYLNGEQSDVILSLAALKAHMGSPEGIDAITGLLETQSDCTLEQLTAMALNQSAWTLCNPPDSFLFFDLRPIIAAQISGLISLVPEQITVIPAGSFRPTYLNYLKDLRTLMRLSPLFPILCLAIIAMLVVRTWRAWLNWWGIPILFAGFISLFLTLISAPLSALTFQLLFAPALPEFFPTGILDVLRGLTAAIVRNALEPALLVAGVLLLAGLVMVALGFLLRNRIQRAPIGP